MRFRLFEKPDGWTKGNPEVLVTRHVAEKSGLPIVKYDGLDEFFYGVFGLPRGCKPVTLMGGRNSEANLLGMHFPLLPYLYVNAPASEAAHPSTGGSMRVLAHETSHLKDGYEQWRANVLALGCLLAGGGIIVGNGLRLLHQEASSLEDIVVPTAVGATLVGLGTRAVNRIGDGEDGARAWEVDPRIREHWEDIVFPGALRTPDIEDFSGMIDSRMARQFQRQHERSIAAGVLTPDAS